MFYIKTNLLFDDKKQKKVNLWLHLIKSAITKKLTVIYA